MSNIEEILVRMYRNPAEVRFSDLSQVCDHYFGEPRQSGGSHKIYKTLWPDDPRVNIQTRKGKAKAYQVRQVLRAIERIGVEKW
ncbi:MAG: toxin HicA [Deltaproteobacteria bacterium]|nr:toxin HicA [Deltaproteobacteria bacterium]